MRWALVNLPDRWSIVSAILEEPEVRQNLEFFRQTRRTVTPFHVWADTITHRPGEPLTVLGCLTFVRDRPRGTRDRVTIRMWPRLNRGELTVG